MSNVLDFEKYKPPDDSADSAGGLTRDVAGIGTAGLSGALGSVPQMTSLASRLFGGSVKGLANLVGPSQEAINKYEEDSAKPKSFITKVQEFLDPDSPRGSIAIEVGEAVHRASSVLSDNLDKLSPEHIKSYVDNATGGYTKPRGKITAALQDIAFDLGSVAGLGSLGGAQSAGKLVTNTFRRAVAANSVKHGAMAAGVSEETANYLKAGTYFLAPATVGAVKSAFGHGSIKTVEKQAYNNVNSIMKEKGGKAPLMKSPSAVESARELAAAGFAEAHPDRARIQTLADVFERKSKSGFIPIQDLWKMKTDLNDVIYGSAKNKRKLLEGIAPLKNAIMDGLNKYGKKHPEFLYAYKNADILHSIRSNSDIVEKVLKDVSGLKSKALGPVIAYASGGKKAVAALKMVGPLSKNINAIIASPLYRSYISDLSKSFAAGNLTAIRKSATNILKFEEKKDNNRLDFLF